MPNPPIDEDLIDRMVELYQLGFCLREVASMCHVTVSCVHKYLRQREVQLRPRGGWTYNKNRLTVADMQVTVFLYDKMGWSTLQVAEYLGLTHHTVCYRLEKAGCPRRTRGEAIRLANERRRNQQRTGGPIGSVTSTRTG
jgi:predicted transcriptional regulator